MVAVPEAGMNTALSWLLVAAAPMALVAVVCDAILVMDDRIRARRARLRARLFR